MIHTLYKSTNVVNKRWYIGIHSTNDIGFGTDSWIDPYIGSGDAIELALKKYGRNSFKVEIIAYFDTKEEALLAESFLITDDWLKFQGKNVYNLTVGGSSPPKRPIWINNGKCNTRIAKTAIIPNGWVLGRLYNWEPSKEGKIAMINATIRRNKINNPMLNLEARKKASNTKRERHIVPHNKGQHGIFEWINNGIINKSHKVGSVLPMGFIVGRLPTFESGKMKRITNDIVEMVVDRNQVIPDGWHRGRCKSYIEKRNIHAN